MERNLRVEVLMQIQPEHIASKHRIGTLHGQPVVEILLKGGLVLITTVEGGKPKVISAGPHRAVARWMAEKNCEDIVIAELSKGEEVSLAGCQSVEKEYQAICANWNRMLELVNGK
jgi:hypothetical protein